MPRESRPPTSQGGSPSNGAALLKQRLQMRQESTLKMNWAKPYTPPPTLSQLPEGRLLARLTGTELREACSVSRRPTRS